ncbi:Cytochrome c oxidase assembly protein cox18, mitochondrial [Pichia californica]|nr:Cytochrome c oxidase assembly protein cox18, mitochondrial [[Candida] californica]
MLVSKLYRPKSIEYYHFLKLQRRNFSFQPVFESLNHASEILIQLHADSMLPWWIFIPLTTFTMRTCFTLPIAIYQRHGLRKQNELRPIIQATTPVLRAKLASIAQTEQLKNSKNKNKNKNSLNNILNNEKATLTADKIMILSTKEKYKRQKLLFKKYNCQTWKLMLLPAIQIPLWISFSYMFRIITGWTDLTKNSAIDMSLTNETFLHLNNLSISDPYFILPITLGIVSLCNAEWNFKTADLMQLTTRGKKNTLRPTAFDVIITLSRSSLIFLTAISTQAPAALVIYWISSNSYSLIQNILMDKFLPLRYTPYERFTSSGKVPFDAKPLMKY